MLRLTLVAKVLLDAGIAAGFHTNKPMMVMFIGFVIADAGALWAAL